MKSLYIPVACALLLCWVLISASIAEWKHLPLAAIARAMGVTK